MLARVGSLLVSFTLMPPSTRHQYREALLRKQQPTNNDDIKQHKSQSISTHYAWNQAEKLSPPNRFNRDIDSYFRTYQSIPHHSSSPRKMTEKFSFKYLGIAFFLGASLFCLYYIWTVPSEPKPSRYFTTQIKLVSVFNRHGDRKLKSLEFMALSSKVRLTFSLMITSLTLPNTRLLPSSTQF